MKIIRKIPIWLRLIAAIAGAGWISYQIYNAWAGTTDTVKVAVVAAIISVFTFAVSKYYELQEIYRQRIIKEKTDVYMKFINLIFGLLKPDAIRKTKNPDKISLRQNYSKYKKNY